MDDLITRLKELAEEGVQFPLPYLREARKNVRMSLMVPVSFEAGIVGVTTLVWATVGYVPPFLLLVDLVVTVASSIMIVISLRLLTKPGAYRLDLNHDGIVVQRRAGMFKVREYPIAVPWDRLKLSPGGKGPPTAASVDLGYDKVLQRDLTLPLPLQLLARLAVLGLG